MPGPLHWFRSPKALTDEDLVERLVQLLVQVHNERWIREPVDYARLCTQLGTYLDEVSARVDQGRLFYD